MHRSSVCKLVLAAGIAAFAVSAQAAKVRGAGHGEDLLPTGKGWGERAADGQAHRRSKASANNGIFYHGGPLLTNGANVYLIWYGNWSGSTANVILTDLMQHLGGSPYFNINTTYYDAENIRVANSVTYMGATTDDYSRGTALGDAAVQGVVSSAINSGRLPSDPAGVYFVLTSADVNETSGFCTQYCGWHGHASIAGSNIKYAFVGNPDRCPNACEEQTAVSPNGNTGADGMASIVVHELEEAVTDPNLNAWYDRRGRENADKCAWTFGQTFTAANGSLYNMVLGSRQYLIQRNWVNAAGGYCAQSY